MKYSTFTFTSLVGITDLERILLENMYLLIAKENACIQEIINHVDDCNIVLAQGNTLRTLRQLGLLQQMQEQFWEVCSVELLTKIVNEEKIQPERSYQDPLLINTKVLRSFSSFEKVPNGPKAQLAKKRGATITL